MKTSRCEQIIIDIDQVLLEEESKLAEIKKLVEENGTEQTEEQLVFEYFDNLFAERSGWLNSKH